jgi:N-acetylmuramoyl-L-alanine amidase
VKTAGFFALVGADMPAVLFETAILDAVRAYKARGT